MIFLNLLMLSLCLAAEDSTVTVRTHPGGIVGRVRTLDVNGTQYEVSRFLGIPYARPPVGELRFQKPQPMPPFTEGFHADKPGNICPQRAQPGVNMSEDCLVLNVFVPGRASAVISGSDGNPTGHAVMVFIHGGGFDHGSGDDYVSDTLASFGDVIVMTINYRLGLLGFFKTGDAHAPGNLGLWDQHRAIQWVNEYIAIFGGDLNRITVFGQSAGASSVFFQSIFPANQGLIHRFICESGSGLVDNILSSRVEVRTTSAVVASIFGCQSKSEPVVNCLRNVSFEELLKGVDTYIALGRLPLLKFAPTVDGDFLRKNPYQLWMDDTEELKMFQSLDAIIGVNSHEGGFSISFLAASQDIDNFRPDAAEMREKLSTILASVGYSTTEVLVDAALAEYTDWSNPQQTTNIRLELIRAVGDYYFTASSTVLANIQCKESGMKNGNTSTFFYKFGASPSNRIMDTPNWFPGANHADELCFVFVFDPDAVEKLVDILTKPQL